MAVVRVEGEEQLKRGRCPDCGGTTGLAIGYVYSDDEPHGVYYVDWCEGRHDARLAHITLSLGDYGDETATGADRLSFSIHWRCEGMGLGATAMRDRPDFLGRFVPRDEALEWPSLDHLWHVCDHLTADPHCAAVSEWLCGERESALASA